VVHGRWHPCSANLEITKIPLINFMLFVKSSENITIIWIKPEYYEEKLILHLDLSCAESWYI